MINELTFPKSFTRILIGSISEVITEEIDGLEKKILEKKDTQLGLKKNETYKVEINLKIVDTVHSEDEAWDIIGKAPFGSLHAVYDENGDIREEFIPF